MMKYLLKFHQIGVGHELEHYLICKQEKIFKQVKSKTIQPKSYIRDMEEMVSEDMLLTIIMKGIIPLLVGKVLCVAI